MKIEWTKNNTPNRKNKTNQTVLNIQNQRQKIYIYVIGKKLYKKKTATGIQFKTEKMKLIM